MQGFAGIALRIWLCAVLAQAFVLFAFFNGLQAARQAEVGRQLTGMVSMVLEPAAAKAALGFPLGHQANLQALIDDMTETETGVDLYLIDPDGVIVLSSDQGAVGTVAPAHWTRPPSPRQRRWIAGDTEETTAAAAITDPLAAPVGTVVAHASRQKRVLGTFSTLILSLKTSALFLALSGAMTVAGVILAVRPLTAVIRRMSADYRKMGAAIRGRLPLPPVHRQPGLEMVAALLAQLQRIEDQAVAADRHPISGSDP